MSALKGHHHISPGRQALGRQITWYVRALKGAHHLC